MPHCDGVWGLRRKDPTSEPHTVIKNPLVQEMGLGFLGLRVGLGFRVQGGGCRVQGLDYWKNLVNDRHGPADDTSTFASAICTRFKNFRHFGI